MELRLNMTSQERRPPNEQESASDELEHQVIEPDEDEDDSEGMKKYKFNTDIRRVDTTRASGDHAYRSFDWPYRLWTRRS